MFTDVEQALVERLKAVLPNDVHVLTASDLADIDEGRQPTPAVHVIYDGYRPGESRPDGKATRISQRWLTVIAVRNARGRGHGANAREDAMELTTQIAPKLMGYQPSKEIAPLFLSAAPAPGGSDGFLYVPLAWSTETVLKASED